MNARQMNTDVTLSLQKVAANRTRKFLEEEVDFLLNKMVGRFMRGAIRLNEMGYYEINERYAQALAPLKEVDIPIPFERVSDKLYTGQMPADFLYLVSPGVQVADACGGNTISHTAQTWRTFSIDLTTAKATGPFWQTFSITLADGTSISQGNFPGYAGYKSKEELWEFARLIQEELWSRGVNVYFETLGDLYKPDNFLMFVPASPITAFTIDGTVKPIPQISSQVRNFGSAPVIEQAGMARVVKSGMAHRMLTNRYYGTSAASPLLEEFSLGKIQAHVDTTFIVSGLAATYIRRPRKIDVKLHRGCDLHPDFHEEICDMAIVHIKNLIADPSWTAKVQENSLQQVL